MKNLAQKGRAFQRLLLEKTRLAHFAKMQERKGSEQSEMTNFYVCTDYS